MAPKQRKRLASPRLSPACAIIAPQTRDACGRLNRLTDRPLSAGASIPAPAKRPTPARFSDRRRAPTAMASTLIDFRAPSDHHLTHARRARRHWRHSRPAVARGASRDARHGPTPAPRAPPDVSGPDDHLPAPRRHEPPRGCPPPGRGGVPQAVADEGPGASLLRIARRNGPRRREFLIERAAPAPTPQGLPQGMRAMRPSG